MPYRSAGNALAAVLSGEVQVSFLSPLTAHGQLAAGTLRPLAVSSAVRFPSVPDIPSAVEAGIPGMQAQLWFGLFTKWPPITLSNSFLQRRGRKETERVYSKP